MHGNIAIKGTWPKLDVDGEVHATKLTFASSHVEALDLTAHANGVDAAPGGSLALHATQVSTGGYAFDEVSIDASGNQEKHSLKFDAHGSPLTLGLAVEGSMTQKAKAAPNWRGNLSALTLNIKDQAPWTQATPTAVSYVDGVFALGDLCLKGGTPSVCVSATSRADGSLQAKYTLQHLPLGLVTRLAAPDAPLHVQGEIEGNGEIARSGTGALNGHATMGSASGSISYPDDTAQPLVAYRSFALDASLAAEHSNVNLSADLGDGGRLEGHVALGANGSNGMPLSGDLGLHLTNLRFLDLLTTSLVSTRGSVEGKFTLAGTTANPVASGQVALHGFATELPAAGIKLSGGEISVNSSDGKAFHIDGSISSGEGKLALSGQFGIDAHAPPALEDRRG